MTIRVLVPSQELLDRLAADNPAVQLIRWDIDDPEDPPDAEVLLTPFSRHGNQPRIAQIPSLRHIHLLALGYDWVPRWLPAGVTVSNSRGAVEDATAELGVALILAGLRRLGQAAQQQARRQWSTMWTESLIGSTVLIVGAGGIGLALDDRLRAFRPKEILRVGTRSRTLPDGREVAARSELTELIPRADVVVIALPLTEHTTGMVDQRFLAGMKDGSLLVNVARGKIVDTEALCTELERGRIAAALDVTDPEPLPADHPLWSAPSCVLTPHMGGNTFFNREQLSRLAAEQIRHLAAGDPPVNCLDLVADNSAVHGLRK